MFWDFGDYASQNAFIAGYVGCFEKQQGKKCFSPQELFTSIRSSWKRSMQQSICQNTPDFNTRGIYGTYQEEVGVTG